METLIISEPLDKVQIKHLIIEKHQSLFNWIELHPNEKWIQGPKGKWKTGQHIIHLIQSLKPLNRALSIPKIFLKYKFGTANRSSRPYQKVVERYKERLATAGQVVSPFSKNMPNPSVQQKKETIQALKKQMNALTKKMYRWREKDLDNYILPHPLMGKMPVREVLMWTVYHVEHHHTILKEQY